MDSGTLVRVRSHPAGVQLSFISTLPAEVKLRKSLRYAADSLPGDVGKQLDALIKPQAIVAMLVMLGAASAAQLTPFGWIADLVGFSLGVYALGSSLWQVIGDLRAFAVEFQSAHTEHELRSAGRHLARGLAVIGVGTFVLWLTDRAARATLSTQQLLAAARSVVLETAEREIAFWSGLDDPLARVPERYATLERMLSETPAGRALLNALKARNDFAKDRGVWYELSERVAELASDSDKPVHYFVAESRGYRNALQVGEAPRTWWQDEGRPGLAEQLRIRLSREGKSAVEISERVAKLENWSQNEIEAQYYAEHRVIERGDRKFYEDEVFQKLEKVHVNRVRVHELDKNGAQVGKPFWQRF